MGRCRNVNFLQPVKAGQASRLAARVTHVGQSAMTVQVDGTAETLASGEVFGALTGTFEMVAVDAQGRPQTLALRI